MAGSDWDESDEEKSTQVASKAAPKKPVKTKWDGEDEEEESPASDWEASSDEEEEKPAPVAPVAAPKKKGTLKAKLAEKEAAKALQGSDDEEDDAYDEDGVLNPRERARRDKEREVNADLSSAAELFGAAALGGTSNSELDALLSFSPRTKDDFEDLSRRIISLIVSRHEDKPLYASFIEFHTRALAAPLKDVEVRKVASGLTTLANEKQKEQRDKASGKKKPKGASKPGLGAPKAGKADTNMYDEALDDFGSNDNDFM